ncbi:UNVERIFIED_CONTAM: hypothetical protein PYX00_011679 [Menopon gallinae]|uniref:Uncharacterized protein n=1 Tax=Menopon gallinae TaxID=328185 RepID=A0AAW2H8F0_9NEOP
MMGRSQRVWQSSDSSSDCDTRRTFRHGIQHIEALKKEFEMLSQENAAIRGVVKEQEERAAFIRKEIKALKSCVLTIQQQIKGQKYEVDFPNIYKSTQLASLKLKVGAGWHIENDYIAEISLRKTVVFPSAISSITMSPDGQWLGAACNQAVYVYSVEQGVIYCLNTKIEQMVETEASHRGNIFREYDMKMMFSACSGFLYTEMGDMCIRKWDLAGRSSTKMPIEHPVTTWARAGDELVVATSGGLFALHGDELVNLCVDVQSVSAVAAAGDDVLALGTLEGRLLLFNRRSGALRDFPLHSRSIRSLDFSRNNGRHLVSGSLDRTVIVSEIDVQGLELRSRSEPFTHEDAVLAAKFFDGSEHVVSASRDYTIRLFSSDRREMRVCAHEGPVVGVEVHGSTMVSASVDRKIRMWSVDFFRKDPA